MQPCIEIFGWGTTIKFNELIRKVLWPWKYAQLSEPWMSLGTI
jgi:hypothetical protein